MEHNVREAACHHMHKLCYKAQLFVFMMLMGLTQLPEISCHAELAQQAQNWVLDFRWQGLKASFVC